jgi:hypothetical protein
MWEKNPAHFESLGVPRGYCGFCQRCGAPGHTRHFPGAIPYTGCWCDRHYRLVSLIHPLGFPGTLLYAGAILATVGVWVLMRS